MARRRTPWRETFGLMEPPPGVPRSRLARVTYPRADSTKVDRAVFVLYLGGLVLLWTLQATQGHGFSRWVAVAGLALAATVGLATVVQRLRKARRDVNRTGTPAPPAG